MRRADRSKNDVSQRDWLPVKCCLLHRIGEEPKGKEEEKKEEDRVQLWLAHQLCLFWMGRTLQFRFISFFIFLWQGLFTDRGGAFCNKATRLTCSQTCAADF